MTHPECSCPADVPVADDATRRPSPPRLPGQATTEYALILLVAAVIAILVIGWATTGGGGGRIGGLFDSMLDMILRRAESAP